jgi:hypothetical protein
MRVLGTKPRCGRRARVCRQCAYPPLTSARSHRFWFKPLRSRLRITDRYTCDKYLAYLRTIGACLVDKMLLFFMHRVWIAFVQLRCHLKENSGSGSTAFPSAHRGYASVLHRTSTGLCTAKPPGRPGGFTTGPRRLADAGVAGCEAPGPATSTRTRAGRNATPWSCGRAGPAGRTGR